MALRWIWTAYGRCLRAPGTRAICQPSMKLVCLIVSPPLRAFQNWFIKSGSFAENIQPYKRSI